MDALPSKFKTWNHFYADFRDKLVPGATEIGYDESTISPVTGEIITQHYRYTLQEIKAVCFDEFMKHYAALTDYDEYDSNPVYVGYAMAQIDKFFNK